MGNWSASPLLSQRARDAPCSRSHIHHPRVEFSNPRDDEASGSDSEMNCLYFLWSLDVVEAREQAAQTPLTLATSLRCGVFHTRRMANEWCVLTLVVLPGQGSS